MRVDPVPPNYLPRTFELSTLGRRTAKSLHSDAPPAVVPTSPSVPAPSSLEVLTWLSTLDAVTRALGATVLQAAIVRFDPAHLESVSTAIVDLADDELVRFLDPMARLTGWTAATRLGKASNLRLTLDGEQRLTQAPTSATAINIGSIGQFVAGDLINITLTQELVDAAIAQLDEQDVDGDTRSRARGLIQRAQARGMDVVIAAAGTDAGALALAAIQHALHLHGLG